MEKQIAIHILEEIKETFKEENAKEKAIHTINVYKKNLQLSTNQKLKNMVEKHKQYTKKYGENR